MAAADRIGAPNGRLLTCLIACTLLVGVLAGVKPEYGVIAAAGLLFAVVTVIDLALGFVMFILVSFLDVLSDTGSVSATKVIGLVLFASWFVRIATKREGDRESFVAANPKLAVALIAMLAWATLSFTWAYSPSTALGGAGRYALDMVLVPIAYSAARTRRDVRWMLTAFVMGAVISSAYGLAQPMPSSGLDAGRLTGTIGEANAAAAILASAIPLLVCLWGAGRRSVRKDLAAGIALVILFVGLVETLSRGGLVAFAVALIAAVMFGGRWRRKAVVLLIVGLIAVGGYYAVLAPLAAKQRVTMKDTSGRTSIWTVAVRVAEAHPLLGVGNDNFALVERKYINRPGLVQALYVVTTPKVAHDAFLEAAADLGIPGLLTLVAVLVGCFSSAIRAAWIFERLGDREMELLSRGLIWSLAAVVTSDFFVASEYAKYLWIPLAFCPVMLGFAQRAQRAIRG